MLKKSLLTLFILVLSAAAIAAFLFLTSATVFEEKAKYFYVPTDKANKEYVLKSLEDSGITNRTGIFNIVAERSGYWKSVRPGRYEIRRGMNLLSMVKLLQSGVQTPVKLVINKFRTREELVKRLGLALEPDSLDFSRILNSADSLKHYGLDTNAALTMIIPNTYSIYWNTSAGRFFNRLHQESQNFWNAERIALARKLELSPQQAYILASIIEEETNLSDEKPMIASVYLNRLKKHMRLGADPTVKFALRDFAIKRIRFKHISESAASPYNTYRNYGLPPGPICTPSIKTIDAVLNAENTDFLFFCAKPDFSGQHVFASNETDHFKNARAYQKALDSLLLK